MPSRRSRVRRGSCLYDNLKSAVLERHGSHVHFNPRLLELAGHYHFVPRPCQVRAGNQKGRVERAIRFVRDSYWAARTFTTLEECNRQAWRWRDEVAHRRPWPDDRNRTVAEAFLDEQPRLLPLPLHAFSTDRVAAGAIGQDHLRALRRQRLLDSTRGRGPRP